MSELNTGITPPLSDIPIARLQRLLRENLEQLERDTARRLYGRHDLRMNRLEDIVLAMGFLLGTPDTRP